MGSTTRKRDKAKSAAPYELAKLLLEAIVDADLFDKPLKVVLRRRRYGNDYAAWWSIETVRKRIFFRIKGNRMQLRIFFRTKGNRKRKVLVTISNTLFNRGGIPKVSKELQELVNSVCREYYRKKSPKG